MEISLSDIKVMAEILSCVVGFATFIVGMITLATIDKNEIPHYMSPIFLFLIAILLLK